jgi:ribose/xylose/arabinose/galactoside ABC-type transport system permease subunit
VSQAQIQAPPARASRIDTIAAIMRFSTLGAFIALLLFNVLFTRHFLAIQTLDVNLTQVASIVIVGVGMTLVIATGGIDLSVGSLMAIAGAIAPIIFLNKVFYIGEIHIAVAVAMIVAILVGGAFGWFNGWLITRFRIQPIIATLVLFIAGRGIAQVMTNGNLQPFKLDEFQWIGLGRLFAVTDVYRGLPIQVAIMIVFVVVAAWVLRRSLFGRQILAIGGNERAARLSGVPVAQVKRWVYCISGLCAGVAGLVTIAINSSSDANQVGLGMELDAIAAVAVGGTLLSGGRATITGTLIGALIIQLVRYTMLANGVPDDVAKLAKAALIVAAVWLQGQGRA